MPTQSDAFPHIAHASSTPVTQPSVGVDIGGTHTRIGLFASLDEPTFTLLARFPTQQAYAQQVEQICTTLHEHGLLNSLAGIGVSIAGRLALDGRLVTIAPNLPAYVQQPLAADLEACLGCPARLAHDTICGLLGEKRFGVLMSSERCAYVTLSTGTGAAIHLEKAGVGMTVSIEIGHQLLDGSELRCLCGQVGCLEPFTGGRQLEQRYGRPIEQLQDPAFWETFSDKLALGLVNLAQLTKVEVIAVSGAIALHNPFLLPLLQQKIDARLNWTRLTLVLADLKEDAPLIGAALLLATPEESILH